MPYVQGGEDAREVCETQGHYVKPRVALTFDDGPSEWTASLLDVLAKHKARATFFVLGVNIAAHGDLLARMQREGHEIGLHGHDHTEVDDLTSAQLRGQIALTKQAVYHHAGVTPRFWRSPWGRTGDRAAEVIMSEGLRIIGTGLDSHDCARSANDICRAVIPSLADETIVCLHDGVAPNGREATKSRAQTVLALPRILEHCTSVTISELLA